ncbi:unnamed protein product [Clavelina lepadiformis]|uniref:Fibronectin type-III domain-containing protein n=1 Tax=Clavelina lepadiformis TaxID=159417 RepID=A0ABP0GMU4_CLALP
MHLISLHSAYLLWILFLYCCTTCSGKDVSLPQDPLFDGKASKYFDYFPSNNLEDLPNAPVITSLGRTSKSDTYLLSWTSEASIAAIQAFYIRYKKVSSKEWKYVSVPANGTSLQLSGLDGSSVYQVEMVKILLDKRTSHPAMSSFRTGKAHGGASLAPHQPKLPSEHGCNRRRKLHKLLPNCTDRSGTTSSGPKVPDAPESPHVTVTSPSSVTLTWGPRSNGGSPIIGYKIQLRAMKRQKSGWKNVTKISSADTRTYPIMGLKRGTSYKFRVIAINKVGESTPSSASSHEPLPPIVLTTAPEITNATIANGSLYLQWRYDGPDSYNFKGFYLNYVLNRRKHKKRRIKNPSVSSYTLHNLKGGSSYSIRLQAFNAHGPSPLSNEVLVEDDEVEFLFDLEPDLYHPDPSLIDGWNEDRDTEVNNNARTRSSQRDTAILIAGGALGFVVIILAASAIIYHKKFSLRSGQTQTESKQNDSKGQRKSALRSKITGQLCCTDEKDGSRGQCTPVTPPQCACYSGANSPPHINESCGLMTDCMHSNRTSVSHTILPGNGGLPYSRGAGSPMYAMVCDGRQLQCCAAAGIAPLWWVRGTDGEFCHIIPHDAKPRQKAIEESAPDDAQSRESPACSELLITRAHDSHVVECTLNDNDVTLNVADVDDVTLNVTDADDATEHGSANESSSSDIGDERPCSNVVTSSRSSDVTESADDVGNRLQNAETTSD